MRSADPDAFDALRLAASALATVCDSDGPALLVAHVPLREPDPVHRSWRQQVPLELPCLRRQSCLIFGTCTWQS